MKLFKLTIVLVLCIFTEATQDESKGKDKDIPIGPIGPSNNGSTTTHGPPTTPNPPKPTNPNPPPSSPSTTTTTTTTTAKPTATTKSTTTTTSTTTSTTTPVPSTTAKPTPTTPAPNPSKPDVGTWNVTKPGTDIKCIMARMAMQIEIDYEDKNQTKKARVNVPANATVNGTCNDNKTNTLLLSWTDGHNNFTNHVIFNFVNNTNTSKIGLDHIIVNLNGLHLPNETEPMNFFYNHTVFEAPLKHSYKCKKDQTLALMNPKNTSSCKAMLKVSQLQIQAFRTSNSTDFEDAINCISSTPDIVPIAVGCALAALVVIVLLAYLYGRRRSQARGYLSMFAETKQEEDYIPMKTLSCFR